MIGLNGDPTFTAAVGENCPLLAELRSEHARMLEEMAEHRRHLSPLAQVSLAAHEAEMFALQRKRAQPERG